MVDSVIKKQVVLTLNQEEAKWLMDVVQNPLDGQEPHEEQPHDHKMRRAFWDALREDNRLHFEPGVRSPC